MNTSKFRQKILIKFTIAILILSILVACGPSTHDLKTVDYKPLARDDWLVSTPEEQALDPSMNSCAQQRLALNFGRARKY